MKVTIKQSILGFTLFLLILPSLLLAASFQGKVVSVSDGDTIKVLKDGKQVKIRLAAIDCPEKGQPYGQKAKRFTADMVAGKTVKVWETDTDRYGRIVGFVFVGDKNLNKELLSAGLAWHYKLINIIKSITARKVFEQFPKLRKTELWGGKFWSDGKYIGTVGDATSEKTIRNYIRNQSMDKEQIEPRMKQLKLFNI